MADAAAQADADRPEPRGARALVGGRRVDSPPLERLGDVTLRIRVDIGRSRMSIRDILSLRRGSLVSLDKLSGEAVDICIGTDRLASGEVIVIQDKLRIRVIDMTYGPEHQQEDAEDA